MLKLLVDSTYSTILKIISQYLDINNTQIFVFGSRATGKNRPFSDIDIGIISSRSLDANTQLNIQDELDESDIPYRVDVVDFSKVDNKFKEIALQNIIKLNYD